MGIDISHLRNTILSMFGHFSWMIRTWLNDLLILFFDNLKTVGFRDLFKLPI